MWRPGRSQKRDLRFASTASDQTASGVIGLCAGDRPPYASSAMRPTAHTQQASSRAVATFALLPWTPRASSASRLSASLRTPLAACLPGHDVEGDCLYRAGVDVESDEGGSIEHGSPFHECGVAATVGLDTHHCRPNPRSFMQQGLSMFLCPAHIVSAGRRKSAPNAQPFKSAPDT